MNSEGRPVGTSRDAAKLQTLTLVAACVLAGCGGSSGGGVNLGPAAKFLGHWARDTATTFSIACLTPAGAADFTATYNPWNELDFERGVLSDASETSSTCLPPGLAFNVSGAKLSVTTPNDPYTGIPPECIINLGPDANGLPVYLDMIFSALDFTLLAPVKDKAPTAVLSLTTAMTVIAQDDGTGTNTYVITDNCTYSGANDTYHRMSQP